MMPIYEPKVKLNTDLIPGLAQYSNGKPVSTKEFIENCTRFRNNLIKHNIQLEMPENYFKITECPKLDFSMSNIISKQQPQKDIINDEMKYCARDYVPNTNSKYCYGKFGDLEIIIDAETGFLNAKSITVNGPKNDKGEYYKTYAVWQKKAASKELIIAILKVRFNYVVNKLELSGAENTEQVAKKAPQSKMTAEEKIPVVNGLKLSSAENTEQVAKKVPGGKRPRQKKCQLSMV